MAERGEQAREGAHSAASDTNKMNVHAVSILFVHGAGEGGGNGDPSEGHHSIRRIT
jgi:hypothetical protein